MFGADRFRHFEETLVEIKAAVTPLARMSTELEAQTKNLGEGLERAFMEVKAVSQKLDKVSGEFAERVEDSEKGFTEKVSVLGDRLRALEQEREQRKGASNTIKAIWGAVGLVIISSIVTLVVWVHNEIYSSREKITKIEMTVEQLQVKPKR